jgi:hypothetical protein
MLTIMPTSRLDLEPDDIIPVEKVHCIQGGIDHIVGTSEEIGLDCLGILGMENAFGDGRLNGFG